VLNGRFQKDVGFAERELPERWKIHQPVRDGEAPHRMAQFARYALAEEFATICSDQGYRGLGPRV